MDRINARALLVAFHYTPEEVKGMTPSGISQRAHTIAVRNNLTTYSIDGRMGLWYDSREVTKAAKGRAIQQAA